MSTTHAYSISPTDFDEYCSKRSEANKILGPLYEEAIFGKARWQTCIGYQRDPFSFIASLVKTASFSETNQAVECAAFTLRHKVSVYDTNATAWDSELFSWTNFEHLHHVRTATRMSTVILKDAQALGHGDKTTLRMGSTVWCNAQAAPARCSVAVEANDRIGMY
jgi:hypothetical protein